eukprot:8237722-Pyramimonas_sp.AAC.1
MTFRRPTRTSWIGARSPSLARGARQGGAGGAGNGGPRADPSKPCGLPNVWVRAKCLLPRSAAFRARLSRVVGPLVSPRPGGPARRGRPARAPRPAAVHR